MSSRRKSRRSLTGGTDKRKAPETEADPQVEEALQEPVVSQLAVRTPAKARVHPPTPPPYEGSADDHDDDDAPEELEMGSIREAVERKQKEEGDAHERALERKEQKRLAQDAREAEWAVQKASKQQRRLAKAAPLEEEEEQQGDEEAEQQPEQVEEGEQAEPQMASDALPEGLLRVLGSIGTPGSEKKKSLSSGGAGKAASAQKEKKLLKRKISQLWKTAGVTLKVDASSSNNVVDVKLAPALEEYVKERNAAIPRGAIRGRPKFVRK